MKINIFKLTDNKKDIIFFNFKYKVHGLTDPFIVATCRLPKNVDYDIKTVLT